MGDDFFQHIVTHIGQKIKSYAKCMEAYYDMKINNPSSSRAYWLIHFRSHPKKLSGSALLFDACGLEESWFLYESSILLSVVVPCPGGVMELHTGISKPQGKVQCV